MKKKISRLLSKNCNFTGIIPAFKINEIIPEPSMEDIDRMIRSLQELKNERLKR